MVDEKQDVDSSAVTVDVAALIPQLTEEFLVALKKRASDTFTYEAQEAMRKEVKEFVLTKVVPAIQVELERNSAELKASMVVAVQQVGLLMTESLTKAVKDQLTGWQGGEFVKDFWGALVRKY